MCVRVSVPGCVFICFIGCFCVRGLLSFVSECVDE